MHNIYLELLFTFPKEERNRKGKEYRSRKEAANKGWSYTRHKTLLEAQNMEVKVKDIVGRMIEVIVSGITDK